MRAKALVDAGQALTLDDDLTTANAFRGSVESVQGQRLLEQAFPAGASAPEELVEECITWLRDRFAATFEERDVRQEDMHFQIPAVLRRALAERAPAS